MKKSQNAGLGLLVLALAGCSGGSTQQLQMSGTDRNYPHSGLVTGEDGRGLIYSSDRNKSEQEAAAAAAPTNDPDELKEFEQWKTDQEYEDFLAWKKAQQEQKEAQPED